MAAYLIANTEQITDPTGFGEYAARAGEIIARHGGQYRAASQGIALEGNWHPGTLVIVEFESMNRLQAFYADPDYLPLKELRQRSSVTSLMAVESL